MRIHGDNVFFSLGGRHEGVASLRQFPQPPVLGAEMEVIVKGYHEDDGLYEVLIPGASAHVEDWSDLVEGSVVEARITGANTGGLECKVGTIRGFIPSSQIAMFRVEDYAEFLEQKLLCVVTEVNPQRKNLVLSRRAVLEREKEEARKQLLASMQVGQVAEGVVRKILDFGAFVDIGGIDGLVHISQLSWDHIQPSQRSAAGRSEDPRARSRRSIRRRARSACRTATCWTIRGSTSTSKFPVDAVVQRNGIAHREVRRVCQTGAGRGGSDSHLGTVACPRAVGRQRGVRRPGGRGEGAVGGHGRTAHCAVDEGRAPRTGRGRTGAGAGRRRTKRRASRLVAKRHTPLRGGMDRASGGDQFGLKW